VAVPVGRGDDDRLRVDHLAHDAAGRVGGEKPIRKPEMMAAISMPVPVKDREVKPSTAASGVGFAAIVDIAALPSGF
jgi:hypothetical protein